MNAANISVLLGLSFVAGSTNNTIRLRSGRVCSLISQSAGTEILKPHALSTKDVNWLSSAKAFSPGKRRGEAPTTKAVDTVSNQDRLEISLVILREDSFWAEATFRVGANASTCEVDNNATKDSRITSFIVGTAVLVG